MRIKYTSKKHASQTPCPFGVGAVEGKHDPLKVGSVMCTKCMCYKGIYRKYYKNRLVKNNGGEVECSAGDMKTAKRKNKVNG